MNRRTCPACKGFKVVEYERGNPGSAGPPWQRWLDICQLCDGAGEIEVTPIKMEDLPCPLT